MNRSYTKEQRRRALQVYKRTQSVTKTVRELGYPGRWTLYKWLREPAKPGRPRKQSKTLTRYPFEVKLRAVELFNAGWRPADIAVECELRSKMSVYSWAQRHREEGKWGLMSKRERKEHTRMPTRAAFERSLADDLAELKKQMAQMLVDKAVLEKELELVKKTSASSRVSSAISTRLKWLTGYAASFRYLCCLLLLILRHQASTTNSNSDLLRISTRISANCFMRLVLSRITPTAIADVGGNCAIAGSLSVRRSSAVSCTKREFTPGSRNESGVTPAIKGKFLPHHLTW